MVNWSEMSELHVVNKLEAILKRWFNVELFFCDLNGKIHSGQFQKDYISDNPLFHLLLNSSHGYDVFLQDVETLIDHSRNSEGSYFYRSKLNSLSFCGSPVKVDGELVGYTFVYPFVPELINEKDIELCKSQMGELGINPNDTEKALRSLPKISNDGSEYLQELVSLVSDEIGTYHFEISKREERIRDLNSELGDRYRYHTMIGKSKQMQKIYRLLEKISSSDSSVFVQGENGTGKELVAKAIHFYSPRKDNIFLALNCSAFNDNLLDSELFGHVKGAFTGAIKDKRGLFEQANGGTLFLDEIGDTSLSMQVKLLRVLQEGTYLPVGATSPKRSDVRIIAATNKPINEMMKTGEFREDLFYRISVINVDLPPLRDREEDVPILIDHFIDKKCSNSGLQSKQLSKKTLEKMLDYGWPGNVRELENEIERLVVLSGSDKMLTPDMLSSRILDFGREEFSAARGVRTSGSLKDALEELETLMIKEGLKRCNFNKSKLSKELGISRASLIMKVDKYGLDKRKKAA
jgi:two-component system, NtrC family, response regulator HupR/HoxA